jgi:hypothetical protein
MGRGSSIDVLSSSDTAVTTRPPLKVHCDTAHNDRLVAEVEALACMHRIGEAQIYAANCFE